MSPYAVSDVSRHILLDAGFKGWCAVEQDCDPTLDVSPIDDARLNRAYLTCIGFREEPLMAQLKIGLIGGDEGSQIGPARRLDGPFGFVAGALDHLPDAGRDYGRRLGLAADLAYGDWREMLEGERNRAERVHLVTVVMPNATHFEIIRGSLRRASTRCAKSR